MRTSLRKSLSPIETPPEQTMNLFFMLSAIALRRDSNLLVLVKRRIEVCYMIWTKKTEETEYDSLLVFDDNRSDFVETTFVQNGSQHCCVRIVNLSGLQWIAWAREFITGGNDTNFYGVMRI